MDKFNKIFFLSLVSLVFFPVISFANYYTLPIDDISDSDISITSWFDHDPDENEKIRYDGEISFMDEVNFTIYDTENYYFKYPQEWLVNKDSDSYIRIENFDPRILKDPELDRTTSNYLKIEIVKLDNTSDHSLNEWVEEFTKTSYPLPEIIERKEIEVSELPAIYLLEKYGSIVSPAVYLKRDNFVYIINFSSNYNNFSSAIDTFLGSFNLK